MYPKRALPHNAIASARKQLAAKQKYKCPLCEGTVATGKPALDHCHLTGNIRATLCQSCNVSEGKVLAGLLFRTPKGNLAYRNPKEWLRKLISYWAHHEANPSGLIHPTFDVRTGKQKPVKRGKK